MSQYHLEDKSSRKLLGGPHYRESIWELLRKKSARNYLEIGVRDGETLIGATCESVGIDPYFAFTCNPVGAKRSLQLFQITSDEFFRDFDVQEILRDNIDFAFIDGMHLFEYILRDFINVERCCDRNSVILLDDCLPVNIEMTERTHRPEARADRAVADWWTGDVWKILDVIREYRPELRVTPVDVQPTGSIIISNVDPESTILYEEYFNILDKYLNIELTEERFEKYWAQNKPVSGKEILREFEFTQFLRP